MAIERINGNTYIVGEGAAIVQFSTKLDDDFDKGETKKVNPPGGGGAVEIMYWGKDNDLPQQREALVADNNIVPSLIERKRNILIGQDIMAYTTRYELTPEGESKKVIEEVATPPQVQAWMDGEGWGNGSNFREYLAAAAGEFTKHGLVIPEYIRTKGLKTIASVEVKECKYMRAGKKNEAGKIGTWYWSGHWGPQSAQKNKLENKKTVPIPVYTGEERPQVKFIKPAGDYLLNDGYYPIPAWWGGWEWIELANQIPQFHKNNIQNGYNLRWHIQIPTDYFLDYEKYQSASTESQKAEVLKDQQAKEQAFMDDVNEFLAGLSNVGRTLFTKYEMDRSLGKEYPGIKITALSYDMKDEALLKLFERSNTANTSAQGLHPSLAGIETAGKLSSGTEIRNAFLMWLIINTPMAREIILSPLHLVKRINGWPAGINYAIRDYELTALSADPSGMQQREEPTATA
jgi:hypothetical protein